ncbi:MAG: type II toxin-antitoxin system RelE/ParE family toxin [Christensenella sp.]|nr:type II toxin-antitoxin system RelE/ParE family toxin [Christensenella sp.]
MYQFVFYEDASGVSELWDFLDDLLQRSSGSKDARIQHKQIVYYIELLQRNGTRLPETITKNIVEDIWELRPGDNRVFYFFFRDNTFVLLHHFRKKSQKTPQREIDRAIAERDDFLSRKGGKKT